MKSRLRAMLESDEGRIPYAYQDHLGYWTIGVGHLIDKRRGGRLPEHIIDAILDYDIDQKVSELDQVLPWWRDQPEDVRIALVNMAFQLGTSGLMKFQKMLSELKFGFRDKAASEALNSRWAKQTPERAKRIAALIGG